MALIVETGAGIAGANSYATLAFIAAYWADRPHDERAAAWDVASEDDQTGAAIEATSYIEGNWGAFYRGQRAGWVQGLGFPRTNAKDDAGYPLPILPPPLQVAVAELAPRALVGRLADDIDMGQRIRSETKRIGPISKSVEYAGTGSRQAPRTSYGVLAGILAPILNGAQPDAPSSSWNWR